MGASVRTPEIDQQIIERLSEGEPLAAICRDIGIGVSTVYDWKDADEQFAGRIARAREIGFDAIAAHGLSIVDDLGEDPASRRVRSEYRLKLLAKWDPKRYGDMLKHAGPDGTSPAVTGITVVLVKTDQKENGDGA